MTEWVSTTRKAAKPHRCESCDRLIGKGEDYSRTACFDGGRTATYIECVHCRAFVQIVRDEIDPMHDGYDYYSISEMECTSPAIVIMRGEWGQKWRNHDGSLMPVPSLDLSVAW